MYKNDGASIRVAVFCSSPNYMEYWHPLGLLRPHDIVIIGPPLLAWLYIHVHVHVFGTKFIKLNVYVFNFANVRRVK